LLAAISALAGAGQDASPHARRVGNAVRERTAELSRATRGCQTAVGHLPCGAAPLFCDLVISVDGIVWEKPTPLISLYSLREQPGRAQARATPRIAARRADVLARSLHPDDGAWSGALRQAAAGEARDHDDELRMCGDGSLIWGADLMTV